MEGTTLKILVCGGRNYNNTNIINSVLDDIRLNRRLDLYPVSSSIHIIEGGCKGADLISEVYAVNNDDVTYKRYSADWNSYKRAAGPIRNARMLSEGKPDFILAFHSDIMKSKGTKDMARKGIKAGLDIYYYTNTNEPCMLISEKV